MLNNFEMVTLFFPRLYVKCITPHCVTDLDHFVGFLLRWMYILSYLCHYLSTFMLFWNHMTLFLTWNTRHQHQYKKKCFMKERPPYAFGSVSKNEYGENCTVTSVEGCRGKFLFLSLRIWHLTSLISGGPPSPPALPSLTLWFKLN